MKLFGYELTRTRGQDEVTVRSVTPSTLAISKVPSVAPKVLNYAQSYQFGRGLFNGGDYDLSEIGKVEDTDAYVRKSFQKKLGLMFKEGVGYRGADTKTIRYVKTRMAQIAKASGIPTLDLMNRVGASLIRTSNAYLVKVRDPKASGGAPRKDANKKKFKPVAAYFPAAPETMQFRISQTSGKIVAWRQMLPSGEYKEFPADDVIHFVTNRREGFHLGVPDLVPVIDDIRALRQIEENIELLLYQCLFPLFHYKVGTETAPAGYTEAGDKEIDAVIEQIRHLPAEGAIVTPERHEINAIGSEGRAIRAEGYLTHFKKRVFSGLGVSDVDMGESDTSNRATALTLSRQLIDTVKAIQDSLECQWDASVINELLLESTFEGDILDDEHSVHLQFHEIDINSKIELAKHNTELFKSQGITWDEYRGSLGLEPIEVPEDPEDQDPAKYPQWFNTYWKLFEEPLNLIRAVDEPFSSAAKAMAKSRSASFTSKEQGEAEKETVAAQKAMKPEPKPAAKPAAKKAAKKDFRDSYIREMLNDFEQDSAARVVTSMVERRVVDRTWLVANGYTWARLVLDQLRTPAYTQLLDGFNAQTGRRASEAPVMLGQAREEVERRIDHYLTRLVLNAVELIIRRVDSMQEDVKLPEVQKQIEREVRSAFDTVRYRADLIWDVEFRKAYNYGRVLGAKFLGQRGFTLVAADGACEECQAANGRFVEAAFVTLGEVPPLHPHSRMGISVVKDGAGATVPQKEEGEPAVEMTDPALEEQVAVCPDCGLTAIYEKRSATYFCGKCNKTVDADEIEKQGK